MTIDLKYDTKKGFLQITITGQLIPDELNSLFSQIKESNEYPVDTDALWDLRGTDFQATDEELFQRIIAIRKRYPERSNMKAAFITANDLSYGMTRMYEILSGFEIERTIKVFRDYVEGEQWLLKNRPSQLQYSLEEREGNHSPDKAV